MKETLALVSVGVKRISMDQGYRVAIEHAYATLNDLPRCPFPRGSQEAEDWWDGLTDGYEDNDVRPPERPS